MFVIILDYIKPLTEIDRLVDGHRAFLERNYANGTFLLSGRQEPRTGGIIIARGDSEAEIRRVIEEDPFFTENAAQYRIIRFLPTSAAVGLEFLKLTV